MAIAFALNGVTGCLTSILFLRSVGSCASAVSVAIALSFCLPPWLETTIARAPTSIAFSASSAGTRDFPEYKYIRPVFYGAFMNATTLPVALRKTLFSDVLAHIDAKDDTIMSEENIFLGDIPNSPRASTENAFFQTIFGL
jgi:hypothetical protein